MENVPAFSFPHFILKGKDLVKVDFKQWMAFQLEPPSKRIVKQTYFKDLLLSTVFLPVPAYGFCFETMILGLEIGNSLIDRCNDYDMALKLHDQFRRIMIDKFKRRLDYSIQFNSRYGNIM